MELLVIAKDPVEKQEILEILRGNFGDFAIRPTGDDLRFKVSLPDDSISYIELLLHQVSLNRKTAPNFG